MTTELAQQFSPIRGNQGYCLREGRTPLVHAGAEIDQSNISPFLKPISRALPQQFQGLVAASTKPEQMQGFRQMDLDLNRRRLGWNNAEHRMGIGASKPKRTDAGNRLLVRTRESLQSRGHLKPQPR